MIEWYQPYKMTKIVILSLVMGMYFYLDVFLNHQPPYIDYIQRYVNGIYPLFMISFYTLMFYHPKKHMLTYIMKRKPMIIIHYILSDFNLFLYAAMFIGIHCITIWIHSNHLELMINVVSKTIDYTFISFITFQLVEAFFMRFSVQILSLIVYLYGHLSSFLRPYIILSIHEQSIYSYILIIIMGILFMMLRWLKYQLKFVNP